MKNTSHLFKSLAAALLFAPLAVFAQSEAASAHAALALKDSGRASAESVAAAAHASVGSFRLVSGVAAVPVWMSGATLASAGQVSTQLGKDSGRAAQELWDFATGDAAKRPPLNREVGLPKKEAASLKPRDPAPAEALGKVRQQ